MECSSSVQFIAHLINGDDSPNPFDLSRFLSMPFSTKYSKVAAARRFDKVKLKVSDDRESVCAPS